MTNRDIPDDERKAASPAAGEGDAGGPRDAPAKVGPAPEPTRRLLGEWPGREEALGESLRLYVEYLLRQNRRFNLTGDRDPAVQWAAHVDDALACGAILERCVPEVREGGRVLDVGSGGGIPGLVWAMLWPASRVTLIEATGKKARFLDAAAGLLGLGNVTVQGERAEELAHRREQREAYDLVTARALAALPSLAEWTVPFVRVGGRIGAIKGPDVAGEIEAAGPAFRKLGVEAAPEDLAYTRSDGRACHLLLYRKTSPTPGAYPRRGDLARRRPLG